MNNLSPAGDAGKDNVARDFDGLLLPSALTPGHTLRPKDCVCDAPDRPPEEVDEADVPADASDLVGCPDLTVAEAHAADEIDNDHTNTPANAPTPAADTIATPTASAMLSATSPAIPGDQAVIWGLATDPTAAHTIVDATPGTPAAVLTALGLAGTVGPDDPRYIAAGPMMRFLAAIFAAGLPEGEVFERGDIPRFLLAIADDLRQWTAWFDWAANDDTILSGRFPGPAQADAIVPRGKVRSVSDVMLHHTGNPGIDLVLDILAVIVPLGHGRHRAVGDIILDVIYRPGWHLVERRGVCSCWAKRKGRPPKGEVGDSLFFWPSAIEKYLVPHPRWLGQAVETVMMGIPGSTLSQCTIARKRQWGVLVPLASVRKYLNIGTETARQSG